MGANMTENQNMTKGKPLKLLFFFALPLMFGNIFQQLYTVVDTAIVGNGVGMEALAALGTVDWLNWMLLGIAQGFTQGFSVRYIGASFRCDCVDLHGVKPALFTVVFAISACTGRTAGNGGALYEDFVWRTWGGSIL